MTPREGDQTPIRHEAQQVSALELARLLDDDSPVQIMDVRAPAAVERGRIDRIAPERFHNLRGSELLQRTDIPGRVLDPSLPVVVVCGQGKDSAVLAAHLSRLGLDARSLEGGMVAWMRAALPRELDPTQGMDRLIQIDRIGKGCLGYILISDGEALILDPPLHTETYLRLLEESGARLVGVADTHVHADYVSGAPVLAKEFGVPYHLHPADAVYPYDGTPGKIEIHPVTDGETIKIGRTALAVMHTPGHTEGSVTYLVEDRIAFTGDFIFVESVGRPDLAGKEEPWAKELWDSLIRAIRTWSDGLAVYPAHYGSERERRMGRAIGASFATLLRANPILRIQDPEVFLYTILDQKAPFPDAYRKIKAINVGLAPIVEAEVEELEVGRNECALGGVWSSGLPPHPPSAQGSQPAPPPPGQ